MDRITRENIVEKTREIAHRLGVDILRVSEFIRESGIPRHQIYAHFPEGGWTTVLKEAGLRTGGSGYSLDDEKLIEEFHRVSTELNKIPSWHLFQSRSKISADTVRKRFGGSQGTLKKYRDWLQENFPESPFLRVIATKSKHEIPAPPESIVPKSTISLRWEKTSGPEFGAPISFRGMTHAPINEQGVVYLFGMVSYELGFIVEAIQPSFPDCEAKHCVDTKRNRWQRVRIEFEYQSRNFLQHGHNPTACDIIVCWENDWPDCPLNVLELRSIINELEG